MTKKSFIKVLGLLLVVGLLFTAAPTRQAEAQTPTTFNVAKWNAFGVIDGPSVSVDGTIYPRWSGRFIPNSGEAPVAVADAYTTDEDTVLTVDALAGVLANDSDPESDPLTAVKDSDPTNGTLSLSADGSFSYTPNADFNGTDTFTYRAYDGTLYSNTATVTITVNPVNDAPVAVDDEYETDEDVVLTVATTGVLANDSDVDEEDVLTAILVEDVSDGTLELAEDGSFVYTPDADFNGTVTFTYKANDGELDSNTVTVTITITAVNDAPVAEDDAYGTDEDIVLTVDALAGVLANDSDVDGDDLTAVLDISPTNGALVLNANGSFSYTPNSNFNGTDTFTYKANDGELDSNTVTVTITVDPVNDAPVAVDDEEYTTDEDAVLTVNAEAGVLANDSDVDENDTLTAVWVSDPANGTLELSADGSFSYTPNADFNGTDTFTYKANDGLLDSNIATVTITVNPVNDAPVAVDDEYGTDEDAVLTVDAEAGVLANDYDVDENDSLTAVKDTDPTNGTLSLSADGSFSYTPNADFNGTDTFTYHANDGLLDSNIATVTITVNPVNDAPVAQGQSVTTPEDTQKAITLAATDVDGDPLTFAIVRVPAHGSVTLVGNVATYTPAANYFGSDSFTFKANDSTVDSNVATVTITVTAVNDAPVAEDQDVTTDEDTELAITLEASDADPGDTLTYTIVTEPEHGTLSGTAPDLTYTPAANYFGPDSFTFKANDGTVDSNTATVTITVTAVNDAPVAENRILTTDEDTPLAITLAATDVDGDPLTYAIVEQPENGSVELVGNLAIYIPTADFNGTDSFTYAASDGALVSEPATVTITVDPVNDAPVAVDDEYTVAEEGELSINAPGVLENDSDVDENDTLTAVWVSDPANGTLELNANGSFSYTPNSNFNGTDSFTYKANDGELDSNTATVTITITAVNDAPVAVADAYGTNEDIVLTVDAEAGVLANDSDVDGDDLTAVWVSDPANGTLVLNADGSFVYEPDADFFGEDSFTYKANDGELDSDPATVTITVSAVNDAPVAEDDAYGTDEDIVLTVDAEAGVLANDYDVDGDDLTAVLDIGPANGTLVLNADGSFSYEPDADFYGTDTFTYKANDGELDSDPATVTINVYNVKDQVVANADAYVTNKNETLSVAAPGVYENDIDLDNNPWIVNLVTGVDHGTLSLMTDGSFEYVPETDFYGTDTFEYELISYPPASAEGLQNLWTDTAIVTITVNDIPVAEGQEVATPEDTALDITLVATDGDEDELTYAIVDAPTHGSVTLVGNVATYTPAANYFGSDSFTFKANDGTVDSNVATVTITVTPVNDAPVAQDQSVTTPEDTAKAITLVASDADPEDTLTYMIVDAPTHGTLNGIAPDLTYTPVLDYNGPDSFTFKANDGTVDSNTATVTITVTAVNDAPVAQDQSVTTPEDTAKAITLVASDADPEDTLTYAIVDAPTHGSVTLVGNVATYTPGANYFGADSFTFKANDGTADSNIATVTITVTAVNDWPIANDDFYEVLTGNILVKDAAEGVLANDVLLDPDEEVSIQILQEPQHGTLSMNDDGSFTYIPDAGFMGTDTFRYMVLSVRVNAEWNDDATVTITVNPYARLFMPIIFR